jgi:outer membrane protein
MNSRTLRLGLALAATGLAAQPFVAHAAQGDWLVRGGLGYVVPADDNLENLFGEPGLDVNVDEGVSVTVEVAYMFADHWAVELLAAYPFSHEVEASGLGKIATVEHLPPTLSLQYHFMPEGQFRPYVGAGLNYTTFTKEHESGALRDGFRLELDDSWGAALQAGIDIELRDNWFANAAVRWIDIDSDLSLNGADLGEVEIDPFIYQLQIGYRFRSAAPAPAPVAAAAPPPPPPPAAPVDSDGDGVVDADDQCPNTPRGSRVDAKGCECDFSLSLKFEFDSSALHDDDKRRLDELATRLKNANWAIGNVEGHTDSIGSDAYNQRLSERRAQAVVDYLASKGLDRSRATVIGHGESKPIADNGTDAGRAQNRRVVISRTDCDPN